MICEFYYKIWIVLIQGHSRFLLYSHDLQMTSTHVNLFYFIYVSNFRLVCTDSMARGIDLPDVQAVFSYHAPKYVKTYIHRAGRTARAGTTGITITLVEPHEKRKFLEKLKEINRTNVQEVVFQINFL